MKNTLMMEIEDQLGVFGQKPDLFFDLALKLDDTNYSLNDLSQDELDILKICVNFTSGTLAGYLQETLELEGEEI